MQPKVLAPFTRDRNGWWGRCAPRTPATSRTGSGTASAPRGPWWDPTARRGPRLHRRRAPGGGEGAGRRCPRALDGRGAARAQRGDHQSGRPAELLRGRSTRRPSSRWRTSPAEPQRFSLHAAPGRRSHRREVADARAARSGARWCCPFSHPGGGVVRARLNVSRRPRRRQRRLRGDSAAARHRGAPGEPGQPVPREGAQDRPAGEARGADTGRLPGRHGELRRRRDGQGQSGPKVGNGRFVLVNAVPGDVPIEVLGRLESPVIMDWDRAHPIMRQIDFAKVAIEEALRVRPARRREDARRGAWAARSSTSSRSASARPCSSASTCSRATSRCGWPSRSCSRRACAGCTRRDWTRRASSCQAGQPILLPVEHGVTTATVTTPSGRTVQAQVTRGLASFTDTDEVGVYRVVTSRGETKVAVNLDERGGVGSHSAARAHVRGGARGPRRRRCPCSVSSGRSS